MDPLVRLDRIQRAIDRRQAAIDRNVRHREALAAECERSGLPGAAEHVRRQIV